MWPIYTSLLAAGLAGSLHCIGMCGPILAGFSHVFNRAALSVEGQPIRAARRFPLWWDFTWYHAGRLWTYAVLGFLAGLAGQGLRQASAWMQWQRPVGIAIALLVILGGVLLLGVVPVKRLDALWGDCSAQRWSGARWLSALVNARGVTPRLILGAIMGLLPCGLVYAMLLVVAALPTPWHAALGMIAFGLGTLPALTAVLGAVRLVPARWRVHGMKMAAVVVILCGVWMTARTLAAGPDDATCPFCVTEPHGH